LHPKPLIQNSQPLNLKLLNPELLDPKPTTLKTQTLKTLTPNLLNPVACAAERRADPDAAKQAASDGGTVNKHINT